MPDRFDVTMIGTGADGNDTTWRIVFLPRVVVLLLRRESRETPLHSLRRIHPHRRVGVRALAVDWRSDYFTGGTISGINSRPLRR